MDSKKTYKNFNDFVGQIKKPIPQKTLIERIDDTQQTLSKNRAWAKENLPKKLKNKMEGK